MNFNIGEKVVFIDKNYLKLNNLKLNQVYTVLRTQTCSCGKEMIGLVETNGIYTNYFCGYCKHMYYNISWFASYMFRKLSQKEIHDEILNKFTQTKEKLDGKEKIIKVKNEQTKTKSL